MKLLSKSTIVAMSALLASAVFSVSAAAAPITYYFTDDQHSTNFYASAASLTLDDQTITGLGSGVLFTLQATLSDPIFTATSKISDLAFNGPSGVFNNFSSAAYAAFRGDVLVDAMSYTGGDGSNVGGIKFNWADNGNAFDTSAANAFVNGKTSAWFIGGTTVGQFEAAVFQNPFAVLHVSSLWLLDGDPSRAAANNVPEPQSAALLLTGLGLLGLPGLVRRRRAALAA